MQKTENILTLLRCGSFDEYLVDAYVEILSGTFNPTPSIAYRFAFPNGYGASVIKNHWSYGGEEDLFELAVIKFDNGEWDLCYDTDITCDVEGHLTNQEVLDILESIKAI